MRRETLNESEFMEIILIIITALLPVAVLLCFINFKDKASPEPKSQLAKGVLYGMISAPLSFCLSIPLGLLGFYAEDSGTLFGTICEAFFSAAIPEEATKLLVLWLLLRKNRYFDEKMDGIVYAVCVSLGFASVENLMYLFSYSDDFLSVGISRALFSVPGHFCFGIIMGYYYSLAKFYPKSPRKNRLLVFFAPVLAHGIFDSILLATGISPILGAILVIVFLVFCFKLWRFASRKIDEHLLRDQEDSDVIPL